MPRLGIVVSIEEAYTQCSKALIRSDLWNPEQPHRPLGAAELRRDPALARTTRRSTPSEYDRERAERYARREGLY